MLNFKELIAQDIKTFTNPLELGEPHMINNRSINITIDDEHLDERSKKENDGISIGEILYFVSAYEYGPPPELYEYQLFDSRQMQVVDVRTDNGLYEIILRRNE